MPDVADDADDLPPDLVVRILLEVESFSNRILVGPKTAGQRLIDDDHVRSVIPVLLGE
jgi:hypothetical protein